MRGVLMFAALMSGLLLGGRPAEAGSVVIPGGLENVEGNSNNAFPFNWFRSMRYQQVFGSWEFASGPQWITELAFRPDSTFGAAFNKVVPDVRIDLSTTLNGPAAMQPEFADNVGADNSTVFWGALPLSSGFVGPAGGPKDFDIIISLTTPFYYDPSAGHLLLDVRVFKPAPTTQLDAHDLPGDSIARNYSSVASGSVSAVAGTVQTSGLVMKVTSAPIVPLPSAAWGALGLLVAVISFKVIKVRQA